MPGPKEFVIDIDQQGNVTIDGKNFEGGECQKLSKEIEQALGVVTAVKLKPEFHRAVPVGRKAGR